MDLATWERLFPLAWPTLEPPSPAATPDSSSMVDMAQGNVPFYEKNLNEVIRRNVRCGRLVYSTDIESFARKVTVHFSGRRLSGATWEIRPADRAAWLGEATDSFHRAHRFRWVRRKDRTKAETKEQADHCFAADFFTHGCAVEDFNWPDRILLGTAIE